MRTKAKELLPDTPFSVKTRSGLCEIISPHTRLMYSSSSCKILLKNRIKVNHWKIISEIHHKAWNRPFQPSTLNVRIEAPNHENKHLDRHRDPFDFRFEAFMPTIHKQTFVSERLLHLGGRMLKRWSEVV